MKYLLDTNVLSEAVKTYPDKNVMAKLKKHEDEIVTASPVWHELQYGCRRIPESVKKDIISSFLSEVVFKSIPILPYDADAALLHAEERARLSLKGETPSFVDGQIACIAIISDLILVTRNISDFKKFQNIKLENWHKN